MKNSILLRSSSNDGREAKKILRECKVPFVEIYSESKNQLPVFYTENVAYPYKGLSQIKEFVNSMKFKMDHPFS